jgi:hypothetical protein
MTLCITFSRIALFGRHTKFLHDSVYLTLPFSKLRLLAAVHQTLELNPIRDRIILHDY